MIGHLYEEAQAEGAMGEKNRPQNQLNASEEDGD